MGTAAVDITDLHVTDVTGQKVARVRKVPADSTIGELTLELLAQMQLPRNDAAGRPIQYAPRLERDGGRALHASETVGEALKPNDHIQLLPNIDAGGR